VADIVALVKTKMPDSGVRGFEATIRETVAQVIGSVAGLPAGTVSSHSRMYGDKFDVNKEGLLSRESSVRDRLARQFDITVDFIELDNGATVADVVKAIEVALESDVDYAASVKVAREAERIPHLGFVTEEQSTARDEARAEEEAELDARDERDG
jgi:hypothetical protein